MATPYTEEEIAVLKSNPYTYSITERKLCLTIEFKELFFKEYRSGTKALEIFEKCGYPKDIINSTRAKNITSNIVREHQKKGYFSEGDRAAIREAREEASKDQKLRQLQEEVIYLRQQVDFLKKISSIKNIKE